MSLIHQTGVMLGPTGGQSFRRGIHVPVGGTIEKRASQRSDEDNAVPGPGAYSRAGSLDRDGNFGRRLQSRRNPKGTMGTQTRVWRTLHENSGRRMLSPRAAPTSYDPVQAAVEARPSFGDDLRTLPLKSMTHEVVALRNLERRICGIVAMKAKVADGTVQPDSADGRLARMVTARELKELRRRRQELREVVRNQSAAREKSVRPLQRKIVGSLGHRPATVPMCCTEDRFYDPQQSQTTGPLGTLDRPLAGGMSVVIEPSMYNIEPRPRAANVAPYYSSFGADKAVFATTFGKAERPITTAKDTRINMTAGGLGPFHSSSKSQTLGPGEYDAPTDVLNSPCGVADEFGNVMPHFMNASTGAFVLERSAPQNVSLYGTIPSHTKEPHLDGTRRLPGDPSPFSTSVMLRRSETVSLGATQSCMSSVTQTRTAAKGPKRSNLPGLTYAKLQAAERSARNAALRRKDDEAAVRELDSFGPAGKKKKQR